MSIIATIVRCLHWTYAYTCKSYIISGRVDNILFVNDRLKSDNGIIHKNQSVDNEINRVCETYYYQLVEYGTEWT